MSAASLVIATDPEILSKVGGKLQPVPKNEVEGIMIFLSAYRNCKTTQDNGTAVGGRISHACGRHTSDRYCGRSHCNDIRRPCTGEHVPYPCRRHTSNQDRGTTGGYHRPAHMGNDPGNHGTNMHISCSCCEWHSQFIDTRPPEIDVCPEPLMDTSGALIPAED